MLGLIQKDLYNLKKQLRSLALFAVLYLVLGILSEDSTFLISMLAMLMLMQIFSTMTYDDQTNWERYALSMPLTKKEIVKSKYILGLLFLIFGGVITSLMLVITNGFIVEKMKKSFTVNLTVMAAYFLLACILLPIAYKYGVEKMRMMMLLMTAIPFAAAVVILKSGYQLPFGSLSHLSVYLPAVKSAAPFLLAGIGIVSYLLSARIFEKKEIV